MADIPLRTYLEEIDGMIDGNRVEEAIAHLKHILGIYPKNLEAYRLLAKGLLEKNRHLDAADVFQRVLSSVPDDFIAHIGMAVVREDEGNLDAAIWHMERAYEVQPNNGPVQEELRRLFAKRDGTEPPRLRLSRAALARMYEKGSLYPQAIAELRAALADDPDRLDLKVLLASALWRTRQKVEAAETSAKLLEVLPFCREANRILAHVWTEEGHAAEAQNYRRRLEALDPYEAYADPSQNGLGTQLVAPENVRVPRLENVYGETATDTARPDWMEALGIQYDQPAPTTPETGDWLGALTAPEPAAPASAPARPQGTGWLEALRGEDQPSAASAPDWLSPTTPAPTLPAAEAPDWLASLGPAESAGEPPQAKAVVGATDWLSDVMGETGQPVAPDAQTSAPSPDVPAWVTASTTEPAAPAEPTLDSGGTGMTGWLAALTEPAPDLAGGPSASAEPEGDIPDWLKEGATAEAAPPPTAPSWIQPGEPSLGEEALPDWARDAASAAPAQPADDLPDWLRAESAAASAAAEPASSADLPDWLDGADSETEAPATGSSVPNWLASADDTRVTASRGPAAPAPEAATDLPDWLASGAEAPAARPAESADLPDWLKASAAPAPEAAAGGDVPPWLQTAETPAGEPAVPGWLNEGAPTAEAAPTADIGPTDEEKAAIMAKAAEEIPDWMATAGWVPRDPSIPLDSPEFAAPVEEPAAEAAPEPAELPDWLKAVKPPEETRPAVKAIGEAPDWLRSAMEGAEPASLAASEPAAEAAPAPPAARQPVTADDLPEWLRQATGDPGETIATFLKDKPVSAAEPSPPAEPVGPARADLDLPEWMRPERMEPLGAELPPAAAAPEPVSAASVAQPDPSQMSPDEALAWLESLAAQQGANEEELVTKPSADLPSWLRQPAADEPPAEPEAAPEPAAEAELPEWLRPATATEPEPAAAVPGWVRPPAEAQEPEAAAPAEMSEDAALAWLESLAARQGASAEELVTQPEERPAETPEWLRASQEAAALAVSDEQAEAFLAALEAEPAAFDEAPAVEAARDELPEWLRENQPAGEPETAPIPPVEALPPVEPMAAVAPAPAEPAPEPAMSEDAALAWLESLAAKQGAAPEELVTRPEARADEVPAWLQREVEAVEPEPAPIQPTAEAAKPDWLKQMEAESDEYEATREPTAPTPEPAPEPAMSEDAALAWLESLAAKQGAAPEELVTRPEARAEEMPSWLKAEAESAAAAELPVPVGEPMASVEPRAEPAGAEAPPELPAWLATETEPEPAAEAQPEPSAGAPAWLATAPSEPAPPEAKAVPEWAPIAASRPEPAAAPRPRPAPAEKAPAAKRPARKSAPKPTARKAPKLRPSRLRRSEAPEIVLALARQNMSENQVANAIDVYSELIAANHLIPDIIADLEVAAQDNPGQPELLRTLGDAYMRDNQLQRALETYKQALKQL